MGASLMSGKPQGEGGPGLANRVGSRTHRALQQFVLLGPVLPSLLALLSLAIVFWILFRRR